MAALGYGVRGIGGYSAPSNQRQPTGAPMAGGLSYSQGAPSRRMPTRGAAGPSGPDTMGQLRSGIGMAGLANRGYEYLSGSPTGLAGGLGLAGGALGSASALNRISEGKGTPMDYYTLAKMGYNVSTMGGGAGVGAAGAGTGAGTGAAAGAGGGSSGAGMAAAMPALGLFLGGATLMNAIAERDTAKSIAGGNRTYERLLAQGVNPRDITAASILTLGDPRYISPEARRLEEALKSGAYSSPYASDEQEFMARQGLMNSLAQYSGPNWSYNPEFEKKYPGALAAAGLPGDFSNFAQVLPGWQAWIGQAKAPGEQWLKSLGTTYNPQLVSMAKQYGITPEEYEKRYGSWSQGG